MARRRMPDAQLSLFAPTPPLAPLPNADTEPERDAEAEAMLAELHERARALRAKVPAEVRFGTSSWSFPGWRGLVFSKVRTTAALAKDGLVEYGRHPLFGTVGVDRTYYGPITAPELARYDAQLPAGFPCCFKAPEAVTSVVSWAMEEGERRPKPNPEFLSRERFESELCEPLRRAFATHVGAVMLELPPTPLRHRLSPTELATRLDAFLGARPLDLPLAVELRERTQLGRAYREVLAKHGVAHVYNYWSAMPGLSAQREAVPVGGAPLVVARLLLRPGTRYEERRASMKPFDRLLDVDEAMRRELALLVGAALDARRPIFVLVNNKAEGSAPLTILALMERLAKG